MNGTPPITFIIASMLKIFFVSATMSVIGYCDVSALNIHKWYDMIDSFTGHKSTRA
jgi:hypothetical protein